MRLSILHLDLRETLIHLYIDNTPAQFAIRKLSAKAPSLPQEVKLLVPILQNRSLASKVFRISTLLNTKADDLSRQAQPSIDWTLPQQTLNDLVAQRGPLDIDLMATAENTELPSFLSPNPDPRAAGCNALAWDWNLWSHIYIFPPKWLIPPITEIWYLYILNRVLDHWELDLSDPMRDGRPSLERWTASSF